MADSVSRPKGRFITFEGGEGAGKSTQVKRLAAHLRKLGHEVVTTREPGGTKSAEDIRQLLVTGEPGRWTPTSEALLNYAARQEHLTQNIRPALSRGAWVICDRFADSTAAYQGAAQGLGAEFVGILRRHVVGVTEPDLTLILDLPIEEGLSRATARAKAHDSDENRYEQMGHGFHETLRQAFLDIAAAEPDRCVVVDAAAPPDAVERDIWQAIEKRFAPATTNTSVE